MDYILRDRDAVGLNANCINVRDFIDKCCVVLTDNGTYELGFESEMETTIYDLFNCRAEMHKIVYQHETVQIAEQMFVIH